MKLSSVHTIRNIVPAPDAVDSFDDAEGKALNFLLENNIRGKCSTVRTYQETNDTFTVVCTILVEY